MSQIIQGKAGERVVQVSLRINLETREWLQTFAKENGWSVNTAVNAIIMQRREAEAK